MTGRVRRVVTRSGKRFRGKTPSRKCGGRMVQWESLLERDAIHLFEAHPLVVSYQEQPSIETYYDDDNMPRRYIPDFALTLADGSLLHIEVKCQAQLARKSVSRKYELISRSFREQGRAFRILTEAELRLTPRCEAIRQIREASKTPLSAADVRVLLEALGETGRWTLREATQRIGRANVLRLIAADQLRIDFDRAMQDDAFVWLKHFDGGEHDPICI